MEKKDKLGVLYAILAFASWGLLPLFWKLIVGRGSMEILAHRILWAFVLCIGYVIIGKKQKQIKTLWKDSKRKLYFILAAIFVTANWGIFILSVNSGNVLQASLGYYINPLLSVLFGVLFFKERLSKVQWFSIVLAITGVLIVILGFGKIPWLSILLALSFGLYGLVKKKLSVDSMQSLFIETTIILPLVLLYIIGLEFQQKGVLTSGDNFTFLMMMLSGLVTLLPLYWFSKAATLTDLSTVGFLQYITPSLNFLLGVFVFQELFSIHYKICFGFIWAGLLLFSFSKIYEGKKRKIQH